mmetsp:Transcript_11934/g.20135  ORF Transcript_11934/g.20135 Transcript_11934/m.20135 type:complete len:367 (-) Transcript_11934:197-1297(-)
MGSPRIIGMLCSITGVNCLMPRLVARTAPPLNCIRAIDLNEPRLISLPDLAVEYDAFLLDQFGVIHDGKTAYPGSVDAVTYLQRLGKKVVVISNSSRRKSDTIARLKNMGFGPLEGDIDYGSAIPISVVTSGDLVWQGLAGTMAGAAGDRLFDDLGSSCFVFGNGEDDVEYLETAQRRPASIDQADFVLARGLFSMLSSQGSEPYDAQAEAKVLSTALARGLPLLVANPDKVRPDGKDSPMPGKLASRYRQLGAADIRYVGKPYALIYRACHEKLEQAGLEGSARVIGVGDSLHHDVLGASRAGIDSLFVCSGVHYEELGVTQGSADRPDAFKLIRLLDKFSADHSGCAPTRVIPAFRLDEDKLQV